MLNFHAAFTKDLYLENKYKFYIFIYCILFKRINMII